MPYTVQFVGLVCFVKENGGRRVLLPDGRNLGDITPHLATIAVSRDDLADTDAFIGWDENDIRRHDILVTPVDAVPFPAQLVQFVLSEDTIVLEGAGEEAFPGSSTSTTSIDELNDDALEPFLPKLPDAVSPGTDFKINTREALTVADLWIGRGRLAAFLYPGKDEGDPDAAVISQLTVPHDTDVLITVKSRDRKDKVPRTIRVKAGKEIAIVNASRGEAAVNDELNQDQALSHFRIYEQLAPGRASLGPAPQTSADTPASESAHLLFQFPNLVGSSVKCSNTGCC